MGVNVAWLGCDLVSGQIIEELQELRPWGPLRRILGEDQSMQFTMPIPAFGTFGAPPPNWEAATEPGRTMIVCVLNDQPVWAGIVLVRQGGTSSLITFGTVTCEGYLDHRFVSDHKWTQKDEASVIAAGLLKDANDVEGIGLTIDAPPTGKKRDREYFNKDNKSVKSALQELAGVLDGIEWTIDLEWTDSTQTSILKIARVRKRIGVIAPAEGSIVTFSAAAMMDTIGDAEAKYEYTQDYSAGRGANHIVAWSSGEGEDQPFSVPARDEVLLSSGMPRWEERFQPSTSISNISTLNTHAVERLALIGRGITSVAIVARADAYPRLGQDWLLGDEIGYDLVGHWHRPEDPLIGTARAIGWEFEPQLETVTPVLLSPEGGFITPPTANWVSNSSFEEDLIGWIAGGTVPPTLTRSAVRAHHGNYSLLIAWNVGTVTNLLDANTSSMETSIAGWPGVYNATKVRSTAQAAVGSASLALTGTMGDLFFGEITANTTPGTGGAPVSAATGYTATAQFRAATSGRYVWLRIPFYNASGTYIGDFWGSFTAVRDNNSGWVTSTAVGTSPIGAAFAAVEVRIGLSQTEAPAVGEVHYVDDVHFHASGGGSFPQAATTLEYLVPGRAYNASAWVWVPDGSRPVQLAVGGIGFGAPSSVFGTWQQISYNFTATATAHSLQLWPVGPVGGGEQVYLDEVEVFST